MLKGIAQLTYECAFADAATRELVEAGAERDVLSAVIDRPGELAGPSAADLRKLLDARGSS
ncbi:MAG: hypothetical protein K8T90_12075 [Planctomycetes bacterium]|nr:hypothetical protein [Planctomycetota bacterium]